MKLEKRQLITVIIVIVFLFFFAPGVSVFGGDLDLDEGVEALKEAQTEFDDISTEGVDDEWEAFKSEKGIVEGPNKGGKFFISSGKATVLADYGKPGWINSRSIAFEKAELEAKANMVKSIKTQIMSSRGLEEIEGDLPNDMKQDLKQVKGGGKIASQAKFQMQTTAVARKLVRGMSVYKTFESGDSSGYEFLVAMVWSPRLATLASGIQSNNGYSMPLGKAKKTLQNIIPKDKKKLLQEFGAKIYLNDKGERVIIAYAQAEPRILSKKRTKQAINIASKKAVLKAQTAIKNFIAEEIAAQQSGTSGESLTVFENGEEKYFQSEAFANAVKSVASKINITGLSTYRKWATRHPLTGQPVAGAIVVWTPEQFRFGVNQ